MISHISTKVLGEKVHKDLFKNSSSLREMFTKCVVKRFFLNNNIKNIVLTCEMKKFNIKSGKNNQPTKKLTEGKYKDSTFSLCFFAILEI